MTKKLARPRGESHSARIGKKNKTNHIEDKHVLVGEDHGFLHAAQKPERKGEKLDPRAVGGLPNCIYATPGREKSQGWVRGVLFREGDPKKEEI